MEKVRTAIIGCGNRGKQHAAAVKAGGALEIVYACDLIPERAQAGAEAWAARPCLDYREVLADAQVEAVNIVTNVEAHLAIAADALRAGKHMILEKPLGHDVAAARAFVDQAERSDRVCYLSYQLRFQTNLAAVRRTMDEIDPVQILFARQRGMMKPQFLNPSPFCGILDTVSHDFDQILWLMARPPRAVTACLRRNTFTVDTGAADVVNALIDFGDGRSAVVVSSIGATEIGTRFDFVGARGLVSFGSRQAPVAVRFPAYGSEGVKAPLPFDPAPGPDPDVALQRAFAEEVRGGRVSNAARPRDGLYALLVSLACVESAASGQRVAL